MTTIYFTFPRDPSPNKWSIIQMYIFIWSQGINHRSSKYDQSAWKYDQHADELSDVWFHLRVKIFYGSLRLFCVTSIQPTATMCDSSTTKMFSKSSQLMAPVVISGESKSKTRRRLTTRVATDCSNSEYVYCGFLCGLVVKCWLVTVTTRCHICHCPTKYPRIESP